MKLNQSRNLLANVGPLQKFRVEIQRKLIHKEAFNKIMIIHKIKIRYNFYILIDDELKIKS